MTINTNINVVKTFIGGPQTINDSTRVNIAPANDRRIRLDITLGSDTIDHVIEFYDAATGGQLMGGLDRQFTGTMVRDHRFYRMVVDAIFQGDVYAIIVSGASPYDITVTEYLG